MRNCPLCGAKAQGLAFPYQTHWNEKDFYYVACSECATTFVDPGPNDADFAKMYSKEIYHDVHYGTLDSRAALSSLEKLEPFRDARKSILDYACGAGGFLRAAGKSVRVPWDGIRRGMSAKPHVATQAEIHGPDEFESSGMTFDIIHLGDILEHLPEPARTMRGPERRLAPGGLFVIEGPLQRNASLVFWSAAGFKALRRAFGVDRVSGTPPTHLDPDRPDCPA